jgi:hypothetical protein
MSIAFAAGGVASWRSRAGTQPYLGARSGQRCRSGDMMRDGVSRVGGCDCSIFLGCRASGRCQQQGHD